MNIYTSYFYQVRHFSPTDIPLSTAVWDPRWYHNFKTQDYLFLDKNGVLNGARYERFVPDSTCRDLCRGVSNCSANGDSSSCEFLKAYRRQLSALPFSTVMTSLQQITLAFGEQLQLNREPSLIFLVHEAPINQCSERTIIKRWFEDNGHPINEWSKDF